MRQRLAFNGQTTLLTSQLKIRLIFWHGQLLIKLKKASGTSSQIDYFY